MNLTVRSGPDAGASIDVDRRITIGREGDLRLTDPTVSRMHAAVTPTSDGKVLLEDLGSTGGTVVNGTRLFGPVTLQGGEQVLMGGSILELEVAAAAPEPVPVPAPVAAPVAPVGGAVPPAPSVPPPPTPSAVIPPPAPPGDGDKRKKQLIVIAVLVAIAVAAIGFVLLSGGNDDPVASTGSGGDGEAGGSGAAGGQTFAPLANLGASPGDIAADPATWLVTLTWDDAPADVGLDHYEVSRNGKRIAADVVEATFVDDGVDPGQELNYDVIAVGSGGTTEAASTVVAVPELAVGDSLVTGAWSVQMTITKSNLNDVGATAQLTWDYTPSCEFGACDATFTIRRTDVIGAIALIAGTEGEYTGVGSGLFLLDDCRGDPIFEDLVVDLEVKEAAVKGGVWAAQVFDGKLQETAESAGCVTARRTFRLAATRV